MHIIKIFRLFDLSKMDNHLTHRRHAGLDPASTFALSNKTNGYRIKSGMTDGDTGTL